LANHFDELRKALSAFRRDDASRFAAALAFYVALSIAPIAVIAIGVAATIFGRDAGREIFRRLTDTFGPATATAVREIVRNAAVQHAGFVATTLGLITLLFGLFGIHEQVDSALNTIWKVNRARIRGFFPIVVATIRTIAIELGIGLLLFVIVSADAAIAVTGKYAARHLRGGEPLWQALQLIASVIVLTALFAIMFRYIPVMKVRWRDVRTGAAFTAFLFVVGKFALGLYLGKAAVGSAYGAAGAFVVVLIWAYWSALIFFFGLEYTHVYSNKDVAADPTVLF
jgi:membrane protein